MGGPVEEELRRLKTLVHGCTTALKELEHLQDPAVDELRSTLEKTRADAIGRLAALGADTPPEQENADG